jgi:hypothetical protein
MSGERSTIDVLMDHIPRCPCSWYVFQLRDRVVNMREELMVEAGATKGRGMRLEVRRIPSGASRDRDSRGCGVVEVLDFMAPHRQLVVDETVTSDRANTNVPWIGARLPLPDILALGALEGIFEADLRTSVVLGAPSVRSVHYYYPFALEDRFRLAPMVVELVDRLAILVPIRRFPGRMGVTDSRSLRFDIYVRMPHFVRRSTYVPFRRFWGDMRRYFL